MLDVGCGTGYTVQTLANAGIEAVGMDFSSVAISMAHALHSISPSASFVCGDVLHDSDCERTFATILDIGTVNTVPSADLPRYISNLHRLLHEGGRLFLMCFSDECPSEFAPRFTRSELELWFAAPLWKPESIQRVRFDAYDRRLDAVVEGPPGWLTKALRL